MGRNGPERDPSGGSIPLAIWLNDSGDRLAQCFWRKPLQVAQCSWRSTALRAATGEVLTAPYPGRTIAAFVDFLEQVEAWLPSEAERVYAILDNLDAHRATDVLLFNLAHPRWEFVFQPKYAAYLNLIEPWWKILRSLALKGRRFETWEEVCQAVREATAYWNAHRHPFVWGRGRARRRRRIARQPGIAAWPKVA
jgi:transposase